MHEPHREKAFLLSGFSFTLIIEKLGYLVTEADQDRISGISLIILCFCCVERKMVIYAFCFALENKVSQDAAHVLVEL